MPGLWTFPPCNDLRKRLPRKTNRRPRPGFPCSRGHVTPAHRGVKARLSIPCSDYGERLAGSSLRINSLPRLFLESRLRVLHAHIHYGH